MTSIAPSLCDISIEEYLGRRDYISSNGLKRMLESKAHLQRYLLRQNDSTPQLDFGTAVHCALLEPERFRREYFALPVAHADLLHEHDRLLIEEERGHAVHFITDAQMAALQGICAQVERHPDIVQLLHDGLAERSLFWRDAETGIRCKIRPDLLVLPHLILELKTTFNASLPVFQRTL
jgi:exodeoxyribonuclease VIII